MSDNKKPCCEPEPSCCEPDQKKLDTLDIQKDVSGNSSSLLRNSNIELVDSDSPQSSEEHPKTGAIGLKLNNIEPVKLDGSKISLDNSKISFVTKPQDNLSPSCSPLSGCCPPVASCDDSSSKSDVPCCGPPAVVTPYIKIDGDIIDGVKHVSTKLTGGDKFGSVKARWGVNRMSYSIEPGLYAVGSPDENAQVIVTANYKLTFDKVRQELEGLNLWILVLDTVGINVWCAAGKGTFGTDEIIKQIKKCDLASKVSHQKIIVPQLGAPGVAAHLVKKASGFKVIYGPIEAEDIGEFLDNNNKTKPFMRRKTFNVKERAVLVPVELSMALKGVILLQLAFMLVSGFGGDSEFLSNIVSTGVLSAFVIFASLMAGAVFTPLLLPFLPGRAFSIKSLPVGFSVAALIIYFVGYNLYDLNEMLEALSWVIILPTISAFFAMNFTGSSTYTSLSGVKKEMKIAVPIQAVAFVIGSLTFIGSRFVA